MVRGVHISSCSEKIVINDSTNFFFFFFFSKTILHFSLFLFYRLHRVKISSISCDASTRHPRYSSTDNASSIVYRGHVLPKNPFNPFFSRRETVFQKFFTFFMNSSPFLSSSQRKIGKNRTSLSKHYYLSLRRFLLLHLRP